MNNETQNDNPGGSHGCPAPTGSAPLRVEVKDGQLIVSIGIKTLAWASKSKNAGPLKECLVEKGREEEWARDVGYEMLHENEIGDTPLTRFLDKMMIEASHNGSGALLWQNAKERDEG